MLRLFVLLGQAGLPIARLYEAHVNALLLIDRYGSPQLRQAAADDAAKGHIFALWVTDPFGKKLKLLTEDGAFQLQGSKDFCSGAGVATRALITADDERGTQMLLARLQPGERVKPSGIKLAGMRSAITGSVDFTGMQVAAEDFIGQAADYLKEPVFSAGAWRGSAAALGGLTALVKLHRQALLDRHRAADPHQQARFGALLIAWQTARLWMEKIAPIACLEEDAPQAIVAQVNLARIAVEHACMEAMQLTQRGLGLQAFLAGSPAELLCRDLAAYLRQPAPDETLTNAAAYFLSAPLPE